MRLSRRPAITDASYTMNLGKSDAMLINVSFLIIVVHCIESLRLFTKAAPLLLDGHI